MVEMLHLRRGERIYAAETAERFDASIYGPLYYLLGAHLLNPQKPSYAPLRGVSAAATLLCAAGCGLLAFWLSGRYLAAVLAPLTLLGWGIVTRYGVLGRCDIAAVLLSFAGFLVAYRFRDRAALWVAAPIFVTSFFYKQQYVAAPLAVLLFLVFEKRYRLAGIFVALLAAGGLAGMALFQFGVFSGQAFFRHFFTYNLLPFAWTRFAEGFSMAAALCLGPFLASLEFLHLHRNPLLASYLGCAFFVSLLQYGREGSSANYFIECLVIVSALFAALLAENVSQPRRSLALLALLAVTVLLSEQLPTPAPTATDFARDRELQGFLRKNIRPGAAGLGLLAGDLARAGLQVPISNLYQYTQLVEKGTLSDHELIRQLARHRFAVVLMNLDIRDEAFLRERKVAFLGDPVRRAILENYRVVASMEMPEPEKRPGAAHIYVWVAADKTEAAP